MKSEAIRSGSVAFSALLEKIQGNLAKFYDTKEKLPGNVYHYTAQQVSEMQDKKTGNSQDLFPLGRS